MRARTMALRWSLVTTGLIALFWAGWYLINGSIPVVTSIKMGGGWTFILPFGGAPRWWDILIAPIWSMITVFLLTDERVVRKGMFLAAAGLILGFLVGLAAPQGWAGAPVSGAIFGLGIGLLDRLEDGLVIEWTTGLIYGLACGLGAGLAFGVIYGLILGLAYGIIFGLVVGSAYGLVMLLVRRQFWINAWNWLMVK